MLLPAAACPGCPGTSVALARRVLILRGICQAQMHRACSSESPCAQVPWQCRCRPCSFLTVWAVVRRRRLLLLKRGVVLLLRRQLQLLRLLYRLLLWLLLLRV